MSKNNVYLNGAIVPADEAAVSVFDAGFLHGSSVFTTLLGHNGAAFRLDRHLARLLATAERIGLSHGATAEGLTAAVAELLRANELSEARIRITLSPGSVGREGPTTTVVTASPLENPASWYEQGLGVIVSGVRQYEGDLTTGVKTGCYLARVLGRQAAAAAGADEALWFTTDGQLAEACFCNVFLVRGGEVHTPPVDTPVLPGIVREAVLELCEKLGIAAHADAPLAGEDVGAAEEIFLTSSCAGVRPVVRVQRRAVGDEKPGPITRKILAAYRELLDQECPAGGG